MHAEGAGALDYLALKTAHITLATISIAGFAARGLLMLGGARVLDARWVRIAPHVVDAALLASGVTLAVLIRASPLAQPWLAAKLLALLGYIVLGAIALRRGRTRRIRAASLAGALALAAYIVATAVRKTAVPL